MSTSFRALVALLALVPPFARSSAWTSDRTSPTGSLFSHHDVGSRTSLFGCQIADIRLLGSDPVQVGPFEVRLSLYRPRVAASTSLQQAAVVILPPTGGVNILDRGYANELCSRGVAAALVEGWTADTEIKVDLSMHDNGAKRALAATQSVVELLSSRGFTSLGLLGTSIGAITGALVLSLEPRIKASALITGSARFADVIAESDEKGAESIRKLRMSSSGLADIESYRSVIRSAVTLEPLCTLAPHLAQVAGLVCSRLPATSQTARMSRERQHLVVIADSDSTVPTPYQIELAQALKARQITLPGSHVRVIRDTFIWHRREIVSFLRSALAP